MTHPRGNIGLQRSNQLRCRRVLRLTIGLESAQDHAVVSRAMEKLALFLDVSHVRKRRYSRRRAEDNFARMGYGSPFVGVGPKKRLLGRPGLVVGRRESRSRCILDYAYPEYAYVMTYIISWKYAYPAMKKGYCKLLSKQVQSAGE